MTAITAALVSLILLAIHQWSEVRRKNLSQERISQIVVTLQSKLQQTLSNTSNWDKTVEKNNIGCANTAGGCPTEKQAIDIYIPASSPGSEDQIVFKKGEGIGYNSSGELCNRQTEIQYDSCPFVFTIWFEQRCQNAAANSPGGTSSAPASNCQNYILSNIKYSPQNKQTSEMERNYSFIAGKNMEAIEASCKSNNGQWDSNTSTCSNTQTVSPCSPGYVVTGLAAAGTPQCTKLTEIIKPSTTSCPKGYACIKSSGLVCKENASQCVN